MGVTTRSIQSERGPRVKLHRNAKTTAAMRALLVHRIRQEQWPPAEAATAAGVSVRTTYKWLRRYRLGGRPALEDASSRPHRQPRRTSPETVAAIVAARYGRRTAWAIAIQLQVPRSTVAAVLVRTGLNHLARLDPPPPVQRYERTRPGELVHLDVKPLGRICASGIGSIRSSAAA
jgi:transposase